MWKLETDNQTLPQNVPPMKGEQKKNIQSVIKPLMGFLKRYGYLNKYKTSWIADWNSDL